MGSNIFKAILNANVESFVNNYSTNSRIYLLMKMVY